MLREAQANSEQVYVNEMLTHKYMILLFYHFISQKTEYLWPTKTDFKDVQTIVL